jgi:hypothetical protein
MAVGVRFPFGCAVQHIVAVEHEHEIIVALPIG